MYTGGCYEVVVEAHDTGLHVEVAVHDRDRNHSSHGMKMIGGPNR